MNRGSGTHQLGDPIWMIESIYEDHSKFKVFTSEAGFKAGVRAVHNDTTFPRQYGMAKGYRIYRLDSPTWRELAVSCSCG